MIAQSRKRAVQMMFQIVFNWAVRGTGIAWINSDHRATSYPLYDSMVGNLYSKKPVWDSKFWTADSVLGPDGNKVLQFEWVDESGNVIDSLGPEGQITLNPTAQIGYIAVPLIGVRRELNTLPAGLKQTLVDYPPTEGVFEVSAGFKTATAWMTLYGNNLPS